MHEVSIEVVELDIRRDRKHDLSLPKTQEIWLQRIQAGEVLGSCGDAALQHFLQGSVG